MYPLMAIACLFFFVAGWAFGNILEIIFEDARKFGKVEDSGV